MSDHIKSLILKQVGIIEKDRFALDEIGAGAFLDSAIVELTEKLLPREDDKAACLTPERLTFGKRVMRFFKRVEAVFEIPF